MFCGLKPEVHGRKVGRFFTAPEPPHATPARVSHQLFAAGPFLYGRSGRGKMTTTIEERQRIVVPGLGALLDFLAASHARAAAFLVVVCLASYLPGFFNIPPVDRDEARFVQATKQMIESGDFVDIRFQDEVRYKKPVGIYWLQAAAVRAAEGLGASDPRTTTWLYRLPSLLGAIGAVLLTYWTALAFGTRRTAYLSALMLACSLLLGVEARLAKTDAMLLLTVVAAFGALARAYLAAPFPPLEGEGRARSARGGVEESAPPRPPAPAGPPPSRGGGKGGWGVSRLLLAAAPRGGVV